MKKKTVIIYKFLFSLDHTSQFRLVSSIKKCILVSHTQSHACIYFMFVFWRIISIKSQNQMETNVKEAKHKIIEHKQHRSNTMIWLNGNRKKKTAKQMPKICFVYMPNCLKCQREIAWMKLTGDDLYRNLIIGWIVDICRWWFF